MVVKKLPIGVNDFSEMIEKGYYFVDKTLLIKDIVDLPGKIKLITRPRRFGKTLNMNMIRRFFSRDEKKELFEGLKIWEEKE
ncbi:MAG: AAA family ATPase, partial [Thermotogae bacterium]|nr:AAA family ATPase [Thermotogota bacterium]